MIILFGFLSTYFHCRYNNQDYKGVGASDMLDRIADGELYVIGLLYCVFFLISSFAETERYLVVLNARQGIYLMTQVVFITLLLFPFSINLLIRKN